MLTLLTLLSLLLARACKHCLVALAGIVLCVVKFITTPIFSFLRA